MPNSTDVRQWLKEQGEAPGSRGQLAPELIDTYNAAHPGEPYVPKQRGTRPGPRPAGDDTENAGVSEDDFPGAPDDGGDGGQGEPGPAFVTGEQPPAAVKPPRGKAGFTRIFTRPKGGRRRARGPRQDLSNWAQDMWADLAWIAAPFPPVSMMLTLQAPYAGTVVDGAVKGTILDRPAQLAAKYDTAFRALDGLIGPPLFTAAICISGQYNQETGEPDNRTKGLFMGLRYSLKQMLRTQDMRAEEIEARAEEMIARDTAIDAIIAKLFGWAPPAPDEPAGQETAPQTAVVTGVVMVPDQPQPYSAQGAAAAAAMFRYPEPPVMDGAGADPARS